MQQRATSVADDEPFVQLPDQASRLKLFWAFLYEQFSNGSASGDTFDTNILEAKKVLLPHVISFFAMSSLEIQFILFESATIIDRIGYLLL